MSSESPLSACSLTLL